MNKIAVNPLLALSVVLGTSAIAALPGMAQTPPTQVVVGYDWSVTGGPLFRGVRVANPPNPKVPLNSTFTLELPGFANQTITAGVPFNLLPFNPSGFSNLSITGIDPTLMILPGDPFSTAFQFTTSGLASLTRTEILQASVPEPSNLLGLGLLGSGAFLKRQLSKKKQDKKEVE